MDPTTLFFEVFEALPRQGPGTRECAARALAACELPPTPRILDLGCGGGGQTLHLASLTEGAIVAVDSHEPLVSKLRAAAEGRGLSDRIDARVADMAALPPGAFDLVWSEGALYNLGFPRALDVCAEQLRPGGFLVFTEAIWRSDDPPAPVRAAFADYPGMGNAADVRRHLAAGPWELVLAFDLPDAAWWSEFYGPMEARIEALRQEHAEDPTALAVLDQIAAEPQLHRDHARHYAYGCFVARRT